MGGAQCARTPDPCNKVAMQRFGPLDRQLRACFARGQRKLPLLKAIKGMILAARQPQSGERRVNSHSMGEIPDGIHF